MPSDPAARLSLLSCSLRNPSQSTPCSGEHTKACPVPPVTPARGVTEPSSQQHFAGPVVVGAVSLAPYGKIKYEMGYLFGYTKATPRGAVRWLLEYEIAF